MACTIESYKAILETNSNETELSIGSAKLEFAQMALQIDKYEHERQKYITDKVLWNDEKASLIRQVDKAREVESYLREQVEECSEKMGIPKSTVDQLKSTIARLETENAKINAELIKTKSKLQGIESDREK